MRRWNALGVLILIAAAGCAEGDAGSDANADMAAEETMAGSAASASAASLPDEDVRTILALDRAFQDAIAGGDWEALREVYAEDAVHMPPEGASVEGLDGIVALYGERNPGGGLSEFHTATDVIHGDDTIGYHRGTWTASGPDGEMSGKFLWVLRRQPDGSWRIVTDMFTSD